MSPELLISGEFQIEAACFLQPHAVGDGVGLLCCRFEQS